MSGKSSQLPPKGAGRRSVADAVRRLATGKMSVVGELTLTPGAAATTIDDDVAIYATEASAILLCPLTANAAAAQATTYVLARANGSFTLAHANNAQTDRTFAFAILG